MPPTTYMLMTLPTEGASDDVWDHLINEAFELRVDGHRHITGEGRPVPVAGLNIDDDLSFGGLHSITDAVGVGLINNVNPLAAGEYILFATAGNLYFRNGSGFNVRITSSNALDMTTVGGIAGDYTTQGAEVAFINASDSYTFKQQLGAGVRQYAKLEASGLLLYEHVPHPGTPVPTTFVGLDSPAGLAGSYTLTFPAALPAAATTLIQQVDNLGVMTWSNTITQAVTLSAVLTANLGITLAAAQDVTLQTSGRVKRANWGESVGLTGGEIIGAVLFSSTLTNLYVHSTGAGTYTLTIPLRDHVQITEINCEVYGDAACNIIINATRIDGAGITGTASNNSTPGAAYANLTINNAALAAAWTAGGQTFLASNVLIIQFEFSAANGRVRRLWLTGNEV
mgnify:CR=1 FL=1